MGRPSSSDHTKGPWNQGEFDEENPLVQLANHRIIMLTGEIEEAPVTITIAHLFNLAKVDPNKPIHLVLNTYGGSVDDMLALYDAIQFISPPVYTLGIGKIMSAGIFLLACGAKGHRQIGRNARCMYHMSYDSLADVTVLDQEIEFEEAKRMQVQLNNILIKHTIIKKGILSEWMEAKRDVYITPEKAIEYGIADKFLTRL